MTYFNHFFVNYRSNLDVCCKLIVLSISTKVGKFLQENLKKEKDKESFQNIITEKALLKNDAIFRFSRVFIVRNL